MHEYMSTNETENNVQSDILEGRSSLILNAQCPNQPASDSIKESDRKRLIIASAVCLAIVLLEILGGILSNSLAIVTDAAHLFSDFGAFMVSLLAIWISNKSRDQTMHFGYHRAEVIGALISVLTIWLITGVLLYMAIIRLVYMDFEIKAWLMLIVASLAIVANLLLACALLCRSKCNESQLITITTKHGINVKSAIIHVIGDIIHSIGVLVASLIIYFKPEYKIADPICTFIFSIIVLCTTGQIMREILRVLMEGCPRHIPFDDIRNTFFSIPEILKVHNLRMWSLTLEKVALSAHIVIRQGESPTSVLQKAVSKISKRFDIYELTLQVEEAGTTLVIKDSSTRSEE